MGETKTYTVDVRASKQESYTIEADSEDEAEKQAKERFKTDYDHCLFDDIDARVRD